MKYSNVYKIKAERCEMMKYIKKCFVHVCITFHFIGGCGNMKDEQTNKNRFKRRANQKVLRKR